MKIGQHLATIWTEQKFCCLLFYLGHPVRFVGNYKWTRSRACVWGKRMDGYCVATSSCYSLDPPPLVTVLVRLWSIRIRAVHRCTTKLVNAHAHGKWNYCVRIVVKVANFEINRRRTYHWLCKRNHILRQWTGWCVYSGNVQARCDWQSVRHFFNGAILCRVIL